MAKIRHLSRVLVLQSLVALTVNGCKEYEKTFDLIKDEFAPELKSADFARSIFDGIIKNREKIDQEIQRFAPRWPIDKLSSIERCILEIGAYELLFNSDTPYAVVLDEAVEMAKEFGDDTAGSFINGVLSSMSKEFRKQDYQNHHKVLPQS